MTKLTKNTSRFQNSESGFLMTKNQENKKILILM